MILQGEKGWQNAYLQVEVGLKNMYFLNRDAQSLNVWTIILRIRAHCQTGFYWQARALSSSQKGSKSKKWNGGTVQHWHCSLVNLCPGLNLIDARSSCFFKHTQLEITRTIWRSRRVPFSISVLTCITVFVVIVTMNGSAWFSLFFWAENT